MLEAIMWVVKVTAIAAVFFAVLCVIERKKKRNNSPTK